MLLLKDFKEIRRLIINDIFKYKNFKGCRRFYVLYLD